MSILTVEKTGSSEEVGLSTDLRTGARNVAIAQIVRRGTRMLALLLAARMLGPAEFGVYAVVLTVVEMVALISGGGYADYLAREGARDAVRAKRLALQVSLLRLGYLLAAACAAAALLSLLHYSRTVVMTFVILSISLIPRTFGESSQGLLRGRRRFGVLIFIEVFQGLVLTLSVVTLVGMGLGVRGLAMAEIAGCAAGALFAVMAVSRVIPAMTASAATVKEIAKAMFAFNIYPLIVNVYDRVDVILLSKLASDAAVGLYSLPYRAFASFQIVPYSLMGPLLPLISKHRWSEDAERESRSILQLLYALALLAITGAMTLSRPLVALVLGQKYQGADVALQILIWALIPVFFNAVLNTILLALDCEKVFLMTASVCTLANVIGNCILIPHYSYRAAAFMTVATESVLLTQNVFFLRRKIARIPLPASLFRLTLVFSVTLAMALFLQRHFASLEVGMAACAILAAYLMISGDIPVRRSSRSQPLSAPLLP